MICLLNLDPASLQKKKVSVIINCKLILRGVGGEGGGFGRSAQTVSTVGVGTVTRFRVISPSGDWLARDWRMVMDS